jgi:hypothetical protein
MVEGCKSHLAVLISAHFGVPFEWLGACFSPWYFPNGKRILITYKNLIRTQIQA